MTQSSIMRCVAVVAMCAGATISQANAQGETPLQLDDVHRVADLTDPAFSPDGAAIIYTVSTHNLDADETTSDIWRVAWAGGPPQPLTTTPATSEWAPSFSGDGELIAYLSDEGAKEETQVWLMPAAGGAARRVTSMPGGVSDYQLSPDGKRVAVVAEVGANVGGDPEKPKPIVIDRFKFKEDGRGYLDDRRKQIFVVDIASGDAFQLTSGAADSELPSWSPDGSQIAFVSNESADPDRNADYDVYVVAANEGAAPRKVSDYADADSDPEWDARPQWSPDGAKLLWLQAGDDKYIYYSPFQLTVADLETGALSAPARIDRWFYYPKWSPDGKILALIEEDRDTWLAQIDPDTEEVEFLTSGQRLAYNFDVAPNGNIVVLDGDYARPYELSAIDKGARRKLTDHNAWLDERRLAEYRDISFRSGKSEIHGILVLPAGHEEGMRYPLIVRLHGGPVYQYSHEFQFDWQLYAAQGYAVLGVNPRGSSGRGFDFAMEIYGEWGGKDVKDIMAGVDHVVGMGVVDPDGYGVGGWSYGGILTDYMIASDQRIKAAVSGAGMAHFLGGYGADQYAMEYEFEIGLPWRDQKAYEKISYPFFQADRITAPTLFQCAGADWNVPCIGSEQMYQAVRSVGAPTQLVVYPGENHSLTRPSFVRDQLERNLDWYDRYLKAK